MKLKLVENLHLMDGLRKCDCNLVFASTFCIFHFPFFAKYKTPMEPKKVKNRFQWKMRKTFAEYGFSIANCYLQSMDISIERNVVH